MPFSLGRKPAADNQTEDNLARRFHRRVRLSGLALFGERVWEALFWPFLVLASFIIVSLLDLWSVTPALLHRILLGGFGIALLVSLLPLLRLNWPSRQEALRRLERDANVAHRPATSYEDRLAPSSAPETNLIWAAHRERLARLVARLKPHWPSPRLDQKDPYALRAVLVLGLVVGVLVAGGDSWNRLLRAFKPAPSATPQLLRLDAWVTPPVYTKQPPIVLADGTEPVGAGAESFRALSVPERSELIVRAHSLQGETVSLIASNDDGSAPETVAPKTSGTQGLIEFTLPLTSPGTADVRIGGSTVAKWRFALIKDEAPTIALIGNPTTTPRQALRLIYRAEDDNGVVGAEAKFALIDGQLAGVPPAPSAGDAAEEDSLSKPPVMALQLPKSNAKKSDGRTTQDLTAHPWAGLKVAMTLTATDQAGQVGSSMPYEFILPERRFAKPLARAVIEQRKKLVRETDQAGYVARALDALTLGDEKAIDDQTVYLGLRNAYWRLANDPSRAGIASVVDQLWDVALRIEDGDLPEAEKAVKDAQEALEQALRDNASPEELDRLIEELRAALARYLQSVAEQQKDKGNMPPDESQSGDQLMSQQDFDKMLSNIQDLAKSGSKDLAQRMLSELKDILDRLQTGNFANNAQQQRASQAMRDMSDLVKKQQKLLDDTFAAKRQQEGNAGEPFEVSPPGQPMEWGPGGNMGPLFEMPEDEEGLGEQGRQGQQGQPGQQGRQTQGQKGNGPRGKKGSSQDQLGQLAQRQQELQQQLQSLMDRMQNNGQNTPEDLESAGEAMGDAKDAIGEPNLDQATQSQSLALDRMRKGAQAMADQMMQEGEAPGGGQGQRDSARDPLGRPDRTNRPDLGLSVKVPDQIDIQRAREVLDELRRRLGDPSRPTLELDYLERLVKPF